MTITEEFAALLDQLALGDYRADGTAGGDIFLTVLPQMPDAAVAVSRYGGTEADARLGYDSPSIQVRVRAAAGDARAGEQRAQDVYDALHGMTSRPLPGGTWLVLLVGVQSGPIPMGRDGNGRFEWAVNFRTTMRRPTAHRD